MENKIMGDPDEEKNRKSIFRSGEEFKKKFNLFWWGSKCWGVKNVWGQMSKLFSQWKKPNQPKLSAASRKISAAHKSNLYTYTIMNVV